jgi:hypothetical protein
VAVALVHLLVVMALLVVPGAVVPALQQPVTEGLVILHQHHHRKVIREAMVLLADFLIMGLVAAAVHLLLVQMLRVALPEMEEMEPQIL